MGRDTIEIFHAKLKKHKIQSKMLAQESGRNAPYISDVMNHKVSPSLDSFTELLEAAERLSPGFMSEFYRALSGQVDLETLVESLTLPALSRLLILVSKSLEDLLMPDVPQFKSRTRMAQEAREQREKVSA